MGLAERENNDYSIVIRFPGYDLFRHNIKTDSWDESPLFIHLFYVWAVSTGRP